MAEEKLLTIRDVALLLNISEKEVIDFAESGVIPAYKIGGVYLRFKREQVEEARKSFRHKELRGDNPQQEALPVKSRLKDDINDFFYFNDFYIVSALIILAVLLVIFRG